MTAIIQVVVNEGAVSNAFAVLIKKGKETETLMDRIGKGVAENTRLRFDSGKDPEGQAWKPSVRSILQGGQTLQDTGSLKASINHLVDGPNIVEIGTNVRYSKTHQFGATITAKNAPWLRFKIGNQFFSKKQVVIPARAFLGIDNGDMETIRDIVESYLKE